MYVKSRSNHKDKEFENRQRSVVNLWWPAGPFRALKPGCINNYPPFPTAAHVRH
ncbi:hypothetical protein CY34DRAFT_802220 [Suillus luteus UH-Slu-Lm8-n1]|uniref:Uncharacterized protein n=1 Tax=Suillus luteus UH-Slu-Lm8-n1 TaxID=930992 RepID=A0A0D0A467_9AGAM|nr:hypothetical protein CY34DRAFT_802220 [Suillus luteus UH-Slu-Lm8-n1]